MPPNMNTKLHLVASPTLGGLQLALDDFRKQSWATAYADIAGIFYTGGQYIAVVYVACAWS